MTIGKGTVTLRDTRNGEIRDFDGRTVQNGNVEVTVPMHEVTMFSGRTGAWLSGPLRSWELADLGAKP